MLKIDESSIMPYFQPIVCVDTSDIFGYEVLGRYCSGFKIHSLGEFFHNPFISSQEKVQVDRMIRFKALDSIKNTDTDTRLFINIQPEWLVPYIDQNKALPTIEQLERYNINGGKIIIEICEDSCENIDILVDLVKRYREAGCKVAIDDVGEGFSNLERIALIRPDYLKIGAGLIHRSKSYNLLKAVGGFCEIEGVNLVLEEVENMDEFQMGLEAGVRYFQGHLFAVPQSNMIARDSCSSVLKQGLEEYMDRKYSSQLKLNQLTDYMNHFIDTVFGNTINNPVAFPQDYIKSLLTRVPDNCIKMYVCHSRGHQITPNYTRSAKAWLVEEDYIGRNWCWRPYFTSKIVEAQRVGRGVFSEPYHDLESHKEIYTFIFPLNTCLLLFIDCYPA